MKKKYKIGDEAWCYIGAKPGVKVRGSIDHSYVSASNNQRYHVIKFDSYVSGYMEVRDEFSISPSEHQPIPGYGEDVISSSGAVIGSK